MAELGFKSKHSNPRAHPAEDAISRTVQSRDLEQLGGRGSLAGCKGDLDLICGALDSVRQDISSIEGTESLDQRNKN